ncbi:MAG: GGDEF domain-containing protein [Sphingomonadales bacterium]|nr:MAG: GGDEF domain-containing protein [Sphingomonadales bacterium]
MGQQLLAMLTPAIAVIFSAVFAMLWWRDRSQPHVGAFLVSYLTLSAGLIVSYFASDPGGPATVLTVHAIFCVSSFALIWGVTKRVGQKIPIAAIVACALIASPFLWVASINDDQYTRLYVQGSLNGLLFAITAVVLWRAAVRSTIDRLVTALFVLLSANFFIRPQVAMMVGGQMTIDEYRASIFYSVHVFSLALFALLLALVLSAASIIDQQRAQQRRSESDPLTGLRLRRAFDSATSELLNRASIQNVPVTVIVADIDHFKRVNDNWGHSVGDLAIAAFGKLITSMIRDTDIAGRIGGEEFCILVWNCELAAAEKLAERIRQVFASKAPIESEPDLRLTASFGVTQWAEGENYVRTFARADLALYEAKDHGRNKVVSSDFKDGQTKHLEAQTISVAREKRPALRAI